MHGEDDGDGRLKVVLQRDGPASRFDQREIPQNSVDIVLQRSEDLPVLGAEVDARAAGGHLPGEVGAGLDGAFEPVARQSTWRALSKGS